jgi:hypothetical protein
MPAITNPKTRAGGRSGRRLDDIIPDLSCLIVVERIVVERTDASVIML